MIRRPPRSTRTDTLFPYTTLFRSARHHVAAPAERTESALNPRPRRAIKPVGGILKDCLQPFAKPRQRTQQVIQRFGSRLRSLHQCTIQFSHFGFKAVARIGAVLRVPSVNRSPRGGEHGFNRRSEEQRVGTEGVSTCRSRWSPYH